jgi:tetratricopeptide (TPR) repeat protein
MSFANSLQALQFTDDEVRALYNAGVQKYQQSDYAHATALFSVVQLLRPDRSEYTHALALALKMDGRHEQALHLFLLAAESGQQHALPRLHAAECLLHLGRKAEATRQLRAVLAASAAELGDDSRQRAQAWLQLVEQGEAHAAPAQ